jgi:RNA polymerase sigma-70 factor, ECF subfamily
MNDNDCSRVFALLSEYLDQELAAGSCEDLEEHLRGCPECIEFVESLKRSRELCRQFGHSQPAAAVGADSMASLRRAYQKMLARRRDSQANASRS